MRRFVAGAPGRLMPWRILLALLRSPLTVVYVFLCLCLSSIGLGGAYLLLTLGLQTFGDPRLIWLLAGFALLWGCFWLYLLWVVLRAVSDDR
jgi:hypothetical protein